MARIARFGVSFDRKLLRLFDSFVRAKGYKNRSEALRDLAREKLRKEGGKERRGIVNVLFNPCLEKGKGSVGSIETGYNCLIEGITRKYIDRNLCSDIIHFSGEAKIVEKMSQRIREAPSVRGFRIEFFKK